MIDFVRIDLLIIDHHQSGADVSPRLSDARRGDEDRRGCYSPGLARASDLPCLLAAFEEFPYVDAVPDFDAFEALPVGLPR